MGVEGSKTLKARGIPIAAKKCIANSPKGMGAFGSTADSTSDFAWPSTDNSSNESSVDQRSVVNYATLASLDDCWEVAHHNITVGNAVAPSSKSIATRMKSVAEGRSLSQQKVGALLGSFSSQPLGARFACKSQQSANFSESYILQ